MPSVRLSAMRRWLLATALFVPVVVAPAVIAAQDADPRPGRLDSIADRKDSLRTFPNTTAGEFSPGKGFTLFESRMGSLNISAYALFRHIDQLPANQTFRDHLGREFVINTRNDLNWHRTMLWFTGFFYDPRFRYNVTAWSLGTTQQTLIFGNLQYLAAKEFAIGVGILPNLTARSLQGSFPFWAGSDRLMAEEFFRAGFSSGVWVTGEPLKRFTYTLSLNNNLSQLGVVQANDTRNLAVSGAVRWQPTTGEFGPRGGFNDFEYHTKVATQFGASTGKAREGRYAPIDLPPNETQIKLSDGTSPYALGALAPGVTVTSLDYHEAAVDWGAKYRGFCLMGEYYFRTLNSFFADGPLPLSSIYDHGGMSQASYMAIPKTLDLHVYGSYIWDQFDRHPWELGGGANYYPSRTRSWRLNLHLMHVHRSAASSTFGYYLAGLTGTIFSLGTDILF